MTDSEVLDLINLAKTKKELIEEMLNISKEQSTAISKEQFDNLDSFLDRKDLIIEKVNDINLKFNNIKSDKDVTDKDLLKLISDINNCLQQIKTLDNENNTKLSKAINDMKSNLKETRQGMKVVRGYGNSDPYQAFANQGGTLFIDQDS